MLKDHLLNPTSYSLPPQTKQSSITGGKRILSKHSRVVVQATTLAAMASEKREHLKTEKPWSL